MSAAVSLSCGCAGTWKFSDAPVEGWVKISITSKCADDADENGERWYIPSCGCQKSITGGITTELVQCEDHAPKAPPAPVVKADDQVETDLHCGCKIYHVAGSGWKSVVHAIKCPRHDSGDNIVFEFNPGCGCLRREDTNRTSMTGRAIKIVMRSPICNKCK